VTFGATLKAGKRTSKIADLFVSEALKVPGQSIDVMAGHLKLLKFILPAKYCFFYLINNFLREP